MKNIFYIIFISGIVLINFSCIRYHVGYKKMPSGYNNELSVFHSDFGRLLYKTNISFLGKDYSGIIMLKQMENTDVRMVFMSEFGLKIFDIRIDNNQNVFFEYIIQELDKKSIKKVLSEDLKLLFPVVSKDDVMRYRNEFTSMLKYKQYPDRYYYFVNENNNVGKIELSGNLFKKIEIEISNYVNDIPGIININHRGLPLKLNFARIE